MPTVFKVWPKRVKNSNGQVLTPEMAVIVTLPTAASTPFANGAKEVKAEYMRAYGYDYVKSCCSAFDFDFQKIS